MRTEKFDNSKPAYDTDDIKYAFEYNGLSARLSDIDVIVAEVCGENDGVDWYWVLHMKDGTFSAASGGCDYTGWYCQSSATINDGFLTPEDAIESFAIEYDTRKVKEVLRKQITGEIPFAVYQE